jgi:endoribonuclease Dicer
MDRTRHAANPYNNMMSSWKNSEKAHLLSILNRIVVSPTSFEEEDIEDSLERQALSLNASTWRK